MTFRRTCAVPVSEERDPDGMSTLAEAVTEIAAAQWTIDS
jgi:hypothetical protein